MHARSIGAVAALLLLAAGPSAVPGPSAVDAVVIERGRVVARGVAGVPWETLVHERVCAPLGITSAGFGVPWVEDHEAGAPPAEPWPHRDGDEPIGAGPHPDNPPAIGPGGTMHMTLEDWARFVADQLDGAVGRPGTLLEPSTYARLQRGRPVDGGPDGYALGWRTVRRPWAGADDAAADGRCLMHGGSNTT